jgi:VanZ family protein
MRPLRLAKVWLTVGCFAVCVLIFQSLNPSPPDLPEWPSVDKLAHFMAYGWIMLWFGCIYRPGKKHFIIGLSLIMLGVALELLQGAGGHRSMEAADACFNALGVLGGWLLAYTRLSSTLLWAERIIYKSVERRA